LKYIVNLKKKKKERLILKQPRLIHKTYKLNMVDFG